MASGYWQIEIDPKDREKTAFCCFSGLFEFNVLPFGLTSAPASFQRLMEVTLAGMQWKNVLVYIDDICIFSPDFETHLKDIEQVLSRLSAAGLKLKPSKCHFGCAEIPFLGHVISAAGVRPDPSKVEAVKNYKVPSSVLEVRQFCGLVGFYRRFIRNFAATAKPLYQLLLKDHRFYWSAECQKAFEQLRDELVAPSILRYPDFSRPFCVLTDACDSGLGAVLSQSDEDGEEKPIGYASRCLTKAERNYAIIEKEGLGIVWAIKYWRHYLYGRKFTLFTDQAPLKWILKSRDSTGRLQQWSLSLQEYDYTVEHRKGIHNANADALSRLHAENSPDEVNAANTGPRPGDPSNPSRSVLSDFFYLDSLKQAQWADDRLSKILRKVEEGIPVSVESEDSVSVPVGRFALRDGILVHIPSEMTRLSHEFPDQLVVPLSHRQRVLQACHDDIFSAHLGVEKTLKKVSQRFFWPNLKQTVIDYVRHCPDCQTKKNPPQAERAPMVPIPVTGPWATVGVDILGPLPITERGNSFILVFTDYLTKWVECFCLHDQKATTVAKCLIEGVICQHSCMFRLLSDQGTNFLSGLVKQVCEIFRVKKVDGTPFHPQTDGLTEKFNATLCQMLSFYVRPRHDDWDDYVPFVSFAYRTSMQASTRESPFYLMYGRDARLPIDAAYQAYRRWSEIDVTDYARNIALRLTEAHELALKYIESAQEKQKRNYDKRVNATNYSICDDMYKYTPVWQVGECKKFVHMWHGPLTIRLIKYPNLCLFDPESPQKPLSWVHVNQVKRAYVAEPQDMGTETVSQRDHSPERMETAPVATELITEPEPR
ncbi:MAG: DDE-type integrase/transposase/recombinase, partial [Gammaproteobacteria bacterium]|nr:DDE-type integrase/transposase/recombinase [Gammaproteobacteria bacterium]